MGRYTKIDKDGEIILVDEDAVVVEMPESLRRKRGVKRAKVNNEIQKIIVELERIKNLGDALITLTNKKSNIKSQYMIPQSNKAVSDLKKKINVVISSLTKAKVKA